MRTSHTVSYGYITLQVLLFATIGVIMLSGIVSWGVTNSKYAREGEYRARAEQIAEAGIDYYRWHLAHATTDYQDGTATSGPYIHQFLDKDANVLGSYSLEITPPPFGTTIVRIRSTGTTSTTPSLSRTVEARLAIPSLAKYAVVANADMRFGAGTEVFGPIHSNGGIRFDGLVHNLVTSALTSYDDPDHVGGNEFGVHTHVVGAGVNDTFRAAEAPPSVVPSRTDVFEVGRQFPVPAVDFTGITSDLATIKAAAQASGYYYGPSGGQGYHIVLKNDDTFDIYRVNTLVPATGGCNPGTAGWGTWSISTTTAGYQTAVATNRALPADGLIFVEDHAWVDGKINTARVTIASGRFPDAPATRTTITVDYDLLYTNYDGSDVISLMAQNNINVGLAASNHLRIDAALVAQNGRVGRFSYRNGSTDCQIGGRSYNRRNTITLYGMIATAVRYGFAYTGSVYTCPDGTDRSSGYCTRNITYDANLLYGPPPSFPLTGSQYEILSWSEI